MGSERKDLCIKIKRENSSLDNFSPTAPKNIGADKHGKIMNTRDDMRHMKPRQSATWLHATRI